MVYLSVGVRVFMYGIIQIEKVSSESYRNTKSTPTPEIGRNCEHTF